ncbi:MAG: hypothetical protein HYZ71_13605 [Deltaproteobacteria bacterium]|nr:hypothetical protein [Deltaproteobacteria bacterium]
MNNLASSSCDFSATDVTWASTCNCPVSGSWTGTCSDGKTATVTIVSCGYGTIDIGSDTQGLTFDRCYSL